MSGRCCLAVAMVLLVSAGLASAQQKVGELRGIGQATVYVMPDTAEVYFSVRAEDKSWLRRGSRLPPGWRRCWRPSAS